jgi:hypothetical protein
VSYSSGTLDESVEVFMFDSHNGQELWARALREGESADAESWFSKIERTQFTPTISQHPLTKTFSHTSYWRLYKQSFMQHLPFSWRYFADTTVSEMGFARQKSDRFATSKKQEKKKKRSGSNSILQMKERTNSNVSTSDANVALLRSSAGLTALALVDGKLLSKLHLTKSTAISDTYPNVHSEVNYFADLNKDGMIESLQFPGDDWRRCKMVALSGLPARSELFDASLCSTSHHHSTPAMESSKSRIPFALPLSLGRHLLVATADGMLAAFAGSAPAKHAQPIWKLLTSPSWREGSWEFLPSLTSFRTTEKSVDDYVTVLGQSRLAIFSRDGNQLASVEIPHPPVHPPLYRDFDQDGFADIIVTTGSELIGLRIWQEAAGGGVVAALFVGLCVAVLVLLLHIRTNTDSDAGSSPLRGSRKALKWTVLRSTDDDHLD